MAPRYRRKGKSRNPPGMGCAKGRARGVGGGGNKLTMQKVYKSRKAGKGREKPMFTKKKESYRSKKKGVVGRMMKKQACG